MAKWMGDFLLTPFLGIYRSNDFLTLHKMACHGKSINIFFHLISCLSRRPSRQVTFFSTRLDGHLDVDQLQSMSTEQNVRET